MDDRVVISLLRHGLTIENERSAYIGWTNSPLSPSGRENSLYLKGKLPTADLVFSSDLTRCQETAKILFPTKKVWPVEELREMHFGCWEGKTYEELKGIESYQKWINDPFSGSPDGGESFEEFCLRVQKGFRKVKNQILQMGVPDAVIITHGGVIRYLLSTFSPQKGAFFEWRVPYGGGHQVVWTKDGFRREETCISLQAVPIMESQLG
jgi:alpha-ribazole phosphatase